MQKSYRQPIEREIFHLPLLTHSEILYGAVHKLRKFLMGSPSPYVVTYHLKYCMGPFINYVNYRWDHPPLMTDKSGTRIFGYESVY